MRNLTVKVKNSWLALFGMLVLCLWLLALPMKAQDISEADLIRAMENLIREASEFSQDLAQYIDNMGEDWEFWFRKGNHTNPVTHKIYFSQPGLRKDLELIEKETDPGKQAKLKEAFKWKYIEIILHEAGHRKYLVETEANKNPFEEDKRPPQLQRAEEDIRNTTALINRLIDILYQLNKIICDETPNTRSDGANLFPGLTPDQAGQLFDRVKEIIEREQAYRQQYLNWLKKYLNIDKAVEEWKSTGKKDGPEWKTFEDARKNMKTNVEIETIEESPSPSGRSVNIRINGQLWFNSQFIDRTIPRKAGPGDCPPKKKREDKKQGSLFKKVDFGLGVKGAYSLARTGDFSGANDYIEAIYKECMESKVSTSCFSGTTPIQLDAFARYTLPNGHRLGLSTGCRFYPGRTSGYTVNNYYETLTKTFDFSFFSILLDISYQIPVSLWNRSLFVNFGSGLDLLSGTIQYDDTATYRYTRDGVMGKPLANGGTTYYRGKLKDSGLGGHMSVGLAYPFKANLEFMLQAGLNFGSLSGFKGTVTDQAGKNLDVILGKEEQATGYWLPLYLAGAMTDQQQAARVSPGGLGISLGLRYTFGRKPAPNTR